MGAFDAEFVLKHYRFPAGTHRKVTDVFQKLPRANHLLPIELLAAMSVGQDVNTGHDTYTTGIKSGLVSYRAIENWSLPFCADRIDIEALDKMIDAMPTVDSAGDVRVLLSSAS